MPRRRFAMLVLLLVGGASCADGPLTCLGADPSAAPSSVARTTSFPWAAHQPSAPEPIWPRTWEPEPGVTFHLRGRVDTDVIGSTQSAANEATFGDLGNVVGLRRARIGVEGDLGTNRRYVGEIDLAPGIVVPRDVYIAFGDRQTTSE